MLQGRRALVTGSTGGIGLAVAEALAAQGCEVVLHGLAEPAEGHGAAKAVAQRHGVVARYIRADLGSSAAVAALAAEAGAVDVLVNNAATRHFGPVEATAPADWDSDLATNLSAPFHLIRLLLPGMRARNWGRIINMSSIYGLVGATDRVGYVVTKTALIGLTRAVALETAGTGITCNALCPGSTLTPNIQGRVEDLAAREGLDEAAAAARFLAGKNPSGRFVEAAAVGGFVAFLCGPQGEAITGAALPMDGGWSAA
ncbi:SDR family oxidoreductase [Roseococcus sp. SDR]|nr:SDR family NAD(P)-dependent oxidoreductase [Roseococcus sp. SDR]MBS7789786.1 SDR family oxidoreductase [Roseococcus sp. SDR]MBV1845100.1 SDR family oxidoreductase [Roseococcus sp. SDR]